MKKILFYLTMTILTSSILFAQSRNTRIFTVFTSGGCGCTGSGGAPETFTTHAEVLNKLQQECKGVDFIDWNVTPPANLSIAILLEAAYNEIMSKKDSLDGVLIIGRISGDYRLAFTGLPTIVVYNLFEFMDGQPYHLFATGKVPEESILKRGTDYKDLKVLNAQLDRRNLCAPSVTESMFQDLVYKVKLIQTIKTLKDTRILMVKRNEKEIIADINYRGDKFMEFPPDHNERYIKTWKELYGVEIVPVEAGEFYETYKKIDIRIAENLADEWMKGAVEVTASRPEIIKTARGYLALEALREKYNCHAVSTHIRTISGSGKMEDRYNPGVGLELGFKTRGIQAVCQNYPDILIGQILGYLMTGRPSMLGDFIYDVDNSTEILLHCGIPINPYGGERRLPYFITTHAESPVRDKPELPGSSTGMRVEWPVGEPVTFWEVHSLTREIRLNTGEIVDGHSIYTGGEDIRNVMCTAKIIAKVDAAKLRDQFQPYLYGIHTNATLGDLRKQIKDVATLLGFSVIESDR